MRKAILLICALFFCLTALTAEGNLVSNPSFDELDSNGLPEDWYRDSWYTDTGVSYLEVDSEGYEGNCIMVLNASENDARFAQDVSVLPDTLYCIRCMGKAQNVSRDSVGANVSVKDTFCYSESLYDTDGEWREIALYGRTGEDQTSVTVCARVGGYSNLNTGCAWFDSFDMYPVDEVPEGFAEFDFTPFDYSAAKVETYDSPDVVSTEPDRYTPQWILGAFGIALAFIAVCRRRDRLPEKPNTARRTFAFCLLLAFVIRLAVACLVRGYYTDINCFMAWSERVFDQGFTGFYADSYFCDYPPFYMALLYLVSLLRRLLGLTVNSGAHVILLKVLPILADLTLAELVYRFAKSRAGQRTALLLGILVALNPAAIADSAAWGQIDSVFAVFTVLSAVFLAEGNFLAALPMITVAILTKPQALLFAPLGLFALVIALIRSKNRRRDLLSALGGLSVSAALLLVTALLFHTRGSNPVEWLWSLYSETMGGYRYLVINAFNLYDLLGFNWGQLDLHPTLTVVAWILFALAYGYSFLLYAKSRRSGTLFLSAAALILLICAFGPMIHERYVYPALILLALAYACEQDDRLLISLGILTVTLFLNQVLVLQGGMTEANFGHLQTSEDWINRPMSLVTVLNALFLAYTSFDLVFLGHRVRFARQASEQSHILMGNGDWKLHLKRADYLFMAVVTAAYAVLTFVNLGTLKAPETQWTSSQRGESVVFDLGETVDWRMEYYGGICNSTFSVELSDDGENWSEPTWAVYDQGEIFRWILFAPSDEYGSNLFGFSEEDGWAYASVMDSHPCQTSRYVRITAESAGLVLTEIGFQDENRQLLPAEIVAHEGYLEGYSTDPAALLDEQDTVPERPSYFNSTYFDEIYHVRTAYEFAHGMPVYEWTHPPLGKVLIMLGTYLFGMNPFGWRFMGALAGVLMLPVIYLTIRQLGMSRKAALTGMLLLALDSMHFTQTRIGTVDSYAVLLILTTYLFMFRYVRMSFYRQPLVKTLIPLGLCGVVMGLSWATKWIGLYASVGLAVLFFASLVCRFAEYLRAEAGSPERRLFWKNALITAGFCVIFFVVIPVLIYYFSYYWHMQYEGGLSLERVWDLQESMYSYHAGLGDDTHTFRSPWYEWPTIVRPMWYYSGTEYLDPSMVSSISCMGNPAVWWVGLIAILALLIRVAWNRRAAVEELLILVGFLSEYLPWILVPRSTFIYHYFASVPFLILSMAWLVHRLNQKHPKAATAAAGGLTGLALILFAGFYPLESGLPAPRSYVKYLRWFHWYNY